MDYNAAPDTVKDLEMLRHEYKAAMSVAIDPRRSGGCSGLYANSICVWSGSFSRGRRQLGPAESTE